VIHQAPETYGLLRSRWRLADLRAVAPGFSGYSLPGIAKALRRLGIGRQRGRLKVHSPDLAYQAKLGWIERALVAARQRPGQMALLYADEFSFYRQPTLAPTYAQAGQAPEAWLSHRANTRYRVSGALDALSGQVVWIQGNKIGVEGLRRFLGALRQAYGGREVFLVWDNWPVHRHERVLSKAAELGIQILWLPTYAPWTNPIEKLWRWLKQSLLHHHRHSDRWEELKQWVGMFLDQFNAPSPSLLRYVGLLPD
jgi:hypothetical protein